MADRLNKGETLKQGKSLRSKNKAFRLKVQDDGDLVHSLDVVFNDEHRKKTLWHTKTNEIVRLILQLDGNLVGYDKNQKALFASNTDNGDRLIAQNDGNLVLYTKDNKKVWATDSVFQQTCVGVEVKCKGGSWTPMGFFCGLSRSEAERVAKKEWTHDCDTNDVQMRIKGSEVRDIE